MATTRTAEKTFPWKFFQHINSDNDRQSCGGKNQKTTIPPDRAKAKGCPTTSTPERAFFSFSPKSRIRI
jgi:hypothetical protein